MDHQTNLIEQQYTAYPYPPPVDDLISYRDAKKFIIGDPRYFSALLWPEGKPREGLRILSAGCGVNEAAALAYSCPSAEVVGIDLSVTSLAHEEALKRKHGLNNLVLRKLDLCDVAALQSEFDLIISGGVLHHLSDPVEGARALASVLSPAGALVAMVYGSGPRFGIQICATFFKLLAWRPMQSRSQLSER